MSVSYLDKHKFLWLIILPLWTYGAFMLAQLLVGLLQQLLLIIGVPLGSINPATYATVAAAVAYVVALVIVIGVPLLVWKRKTTINELGAHDWPSWMDVVLSVPAFVVYIICSGLVMAILTSILPGIDLQQAQELPFSQSMLGTSWQYVLAFITMVVLAPLAEELLFRGYLYGKLRKTASVWVSILVASLAFGLAHLWVGSSTLQWAVTIDTFVLSLMLCALREYTGAVWAGVLLHAIKNGLAFYLLFINPSVVDQIQQAANLLW